MAERNKMCGDCALFSAGSVTNKVIERYTKIATDIFGLKKGQEMAEYLQAIQRTGGGTRLCGASRPFAYTFDNCDTPKEFVRLL